MYTSSSFHCFNRGLRDRVKPHPFKVRNGEGSRTIMTAQLHKIMHGKEVLHLDVQGTVGRVFMYIS